MIKKINMLILKKLFFVLKEKKINRNQYYLKIIIIIEFDFRELAFKKNNGPFVLLVS